MNKSFEKAFAALNEQQRLAVQTIAGPLLVIAGPGTGKTQLLALRAANILKTDTTMLPSNILCLTFTDNAANNMRERLIEFIGRDAYQVSIHTFNSFGAYIMNMYPEYFFEWRETQTADELTAHRILEEILSSLSGDHILAARGIDGTYYSLKQLKNFISDAKRNNLTPANLKALLKQNEAACLELTPLIRKYWPSRMTADSLGQLAELAEAVAKLKEDPPVVEMLAPLKGMAVSTLLQALADSQALSKGATKPFTAWKDEWLAKDADNKWVLSAEASREKLAAACEIYRQYQHSLESRGLADFNDQIMWTLKVLQQHIELRYSLQERFQYVMVDEFQDTNRAQLLMTKAITDAPVHEGRPNIMAVGDDDQAIYRFQGADIGNVLVFESGYEKPAQVTLVKNYRSNTDILKSSRLIGSQIQASLEKQRGITKKLESDIKKSGVGVDLCEFEHEAAHYSWVAESIAKLLEKGESGSEIAVLARERVQLDELLPYLRARDIPISYERRENVLEQEHVLVLLKLCRLTAFLSQQKLEEANSLLAEILSEPMWGITPPELWRIARTAYTESKFWLDVIYEQNDSRARQVADFLVELSGQAATQPFEVTLDRLIGTGPAAPQDETEDEAGPAAPQEGFVSPFKEYFFGGKIKDDPARYLTLLSHLNTLRSHVRSYQQNYRRTLTVIDLLEFVDSYNRTETLMMLDHAPHCENLEAVSLMTVHKAKGLEFDNVFLISLQNAAWTRGGSRGRFAYPQNLEEIKPSRNQDDDGLRLLYVGMTRARQSLFMCYFLTADSGKPEQPYAPLLALDIKPSAIKDERPAAEIAEQYEQRWLSHHRSASRADMRACLDDILANYRLSATHLNNFLDVSRGGPMLFLTNNLLHFPAAKTANAIYGSAIHSTLNFVHGSYKAARKLNVEKVVDFFKSELNRQPLSETDKQYFLARGEASLRAFLSIEGPSLDAAQLSEFDFNNQGAVVGDARLRGLIDRLDLDKKNKFVDVSDYKTGSAARKWQTAPGAKEYEKIKLHRYKNQLLFYKLLVDGSSEWGRRGWKARKGILRFIEPDTYGKIRCLELDYDTADMERFKKLVGSVWGRIQKLDFPETGEYPQTLAGIEQFEKDLLG